MLEHLRVRNLALAENIAVRMEPGLNIISGETGAGKSILMGALSLLVGERADKSMIRTGEKQCSAEAVFMLRNAARINAILEENGLDPCEENQLIIRRVIKASGSSQTLVNDGPVTLQTLRRIGDELVDMHGPHEHQSLLKQDVQLGLLDAFGRLDDARLAFEERYRGKRVLENRRRELAMDDEDIADKIDRLSFRIREIEEAAIEEDEEEKVLDEHKIAGNAHRILELAGAVTQLLTEGETPMFDQLATTQSQLEELARLIPAAESWSEEMITIVTQLQELSAAIQGEIDMIDMDPSRLEWLDQRLAVFQKLKRKYGGSMASVLETLETSKAALHDLTTRKERLVEIDREIEVQDKTMRQQGRELNKKRRQTATKMARAVTEELKALGFPHGSFSVDIYDVEPSSSGMDEVDFGFAPNMGETMRPLRNIASSGEISRVMLAVKAVLAACDRIPILVFDEIDANLGGEMGHAVGAKLVGVAANHQVICITHLPQVAVHGFCHYAVSKHVKDGRTFSRVDLLDNERRVEEIARMLGGGERSAVSMDHAREMLRQAGH